MKDITGFKALWHTVFHDDFSVIDVFFDAFPMAELAAAEHMDGRLAAAAYVLPFGDLVSDTGRYPCAHIYAVAVHPDFRGKGLGISVTNKAVLLAESLGFSAVVLHPASDKLFDFYRVHCGFSTCFSSEIKNITLPSAPSVPMAQSGVREYRSVREKLLSYRTHIDISESILELFRKLGGRLYTFDGGCAAVEDADGTAFFRELLCRDSNPPLASMTSLNNAVVFSPSRGTGDRYPFGMMKSGSFQDAWMGISLE